MHEFAERGVASHWQYKSSEKFNSLSWKEYDWLKDLVEIIEKNENPEDSYEYTKLQMFQENVFCFTPKGDVISLPKGSTALDFAFNIHTQLGLKTRGAKVNGKIVPLNHKLKSGDQVEIIKSNKSKPNASWLDYVITSIAKKSIRSSLKLSLIHI